MTPIDGLILFILVVSAGLGLAHGFAREVLGLAGLVVGVILGALLAPGLGGSLFGWLPGPLGLAGAFLTVFLGCLLIAALIGRLMTAILNAASLSLPNRILGGLFGLARAAMFLMALMVALDFMGIDAGKWLEGSRIGQPAWEAAQRVRAGFGGSPVNAPAVPPNSPKQSTI